MFDKGAKLAAILSVSVTALLLSGAAGAESPKTPESKETKVTKQGAMPKAEAKEQKGTAPSPRALENKLEVTTSRTENLDEQTRSLGKDVEVQREDAADSQARYEERARAAYKGEDVADVSVAVEGLLGGSATKSRAVFGGQVFQALDEGSESVTSRRVTRQVLGGTARKLSQKKKEHGRVEKERRVRAENVRSRARQVEVSAREFGPVEEQVERRIEQLRTQELAGLLERPPASGGGQQVVEEEREFEIAREEIEASPVEPLSKKRYVQIYKAAAKRYGFEEDWYVLAAVGKVESDHGANMGPSSAGAMGPMQFLPSTWQQYGVDGNGDGVENIMDPEDAIPGAAAYLKAGGAPDDWYAALYTYNHAGWYVRKVLGTAETYRLQADDDEVESYTRIQPKD